MAAVAIYGFVTISWLLIGAWIRESRPSSAKILLVLAVIAGSFLLGWVITPVR